MKFSIFKKNGFTLIEVLVGIFVILIVSSVIAGAFREFRDTQVLNDNAENTANLINEARSKTLASKKSLQYGIHMETSRLVIFEGDVFGEPNPTNREIAISPQIEISSISLNEGVNDVIFQKLTGETSQYGTITLRLKRNPSKTKSVNIGQSGIITIQ